MQQKAIFFCFSIIHYKDTIISIGASISTEQELNNAKTDIFLTIIVKLSQYLCINKNKGIMSKSEKIAASLRIADNMMHRASTNSDFEKLSEMMSDEMLKLIEEMGLVLA